MRTFLALPIKEDIRRKLGIFVRSVRGRIKSRVKWVEEENLHFTIFFFGEIDRKQVERIGSVIDKKNPDFKKFNVKLKDISFFPDERRVRVIWFGIDEGEKGMKLIYSTLYPEFSKFLKLKKENFIPHLTIGRAKFGLKEEEVQILKEKRINLPSFTIDKLILFESKLTPKGPIYTPIKRSLFR